MNNLIQPGYRPEGMNMWDVWYHNENDTVHAFYLQRLSPNSSRKKEDEDFIGHAATSNMITWKEKHLTIGPGKEDELDDMQPWTGCIYKFKQKYYLYYTMRCKKQSGRSQKIGLAISDDLYNWQKYKNNPVITPDERYYVSDKNPYPENKVDCRDLILVKDNKSDYVYGFYAACVHAEEESEAACIACVRTLDGINFEQLPPACRPMKYSEIEVPDVFFLNGKWYMTLLSSVMHGNLADYSDKYVTCATIYAISDNIEGPYDVFEEDNVLMGGIDMSYGPSLRSVDFKGRKYGFCTFSLTNGHAVLSPAFEYFVQEDNKLRLKYSMLNKKLKEKTILNETLPQKLKTPRTHYTGGITNGKFKIQDNKVECESRSGWQCGYIDSGSKNMEIECIINCKSGVGVGICLTKNYDLPFVKDDFVTSLVFRENYLLCGHLPLFSTVSKREIALEYNTDYNLKLCIRYSRFEIYVDDILYNTGNIKFSNTNNNDDYLMFQNVAVGFFIDRAKADISKLIIRKMFD